MIILLKKADFFLFDEKLAIRVWRIISIIEKLLKKPVTFAITDMIWTLIDRKRIETINFNIFLISFNLIHTIPVSNNLDLTFSHGWIYILCLLQELFSVSVCLSVSLSHTHTHTHTHLLSLFFTFHSCRLSFSSVGMLNFTHTHTHTHTHTRIRPGL